MRKKSTFVRIREETDKKVEELAKMYGMSKSVIYDKAAEFMFDYDLEELVLLNKREKALKRLCEKVSSGEVVVNSDSREVIVDREEKEEQKEEKKERPIKRKLKL